MKGGTRASSTCCVDTW